MAADGGWAGGDAAREAAAAALGMHLAAGRLSTAEFQARLDAVYAARTPGDLAAVTADLPAAGPGADGPSGPGPDVAALWSAGRRAAGRVLAGVAALGAAGVAGVVLLLAALAGHGSLLVAGLVLTFVPVALVAGAAGALVWAGRRAWRRGALLEAGAAAAGMPWAGRAAWALRVLLVSRLFARVAGWAGRPLPGGRRRGGGRRGNGRAGARQAAAWYQDEPGGTWRQARVDVRGPGR